MTSASDVLTFSGEGTPERYFVQGTMIWDTVNMGVYRRYTHHDAAVAAATVLNAATHRIRAREGMPLVIPLWERRKHPKAGIGFGPQTMGYTMGYIT